MKPCVYLLLHSVVVLARRQALSSPQQQFVPVKYAVTRLGAGMTQSGQLFPGGLDQTTPSLMLQPGALVAVQNFECAQSGGYARIEGYERYDGQASPSEATYNIVQVDAFTNVPTVGQTITQAATGATGVIIAVVETPLPYMAVTKVTGIFNQTDAITTPGPVAIGNAVVTVVPVTSLLSAQYTSAAADEYRTDIGAVPGSGPMLGVVSMIFNSVNNVYAFRANVGNTAVDIYKSSAAGWVSVPFFNTISYINGGGNQTLEPGTGGQVIIAGQIEIVSDILTIQNDAGITVEGELQVSDAQPEPQDGDVLMQGAVSATIKRVMEQTGTWEGGTSAGQFVIDTPVGGNFVAGAALTSSGVAITLTGAPVAISLSPGGHFEFVKCNFSGQLSTRRIYGCDGVNQAFEFDGVTLAPISTGLSPDVPQHICFHNNYLLLSKDSSIIGSGPGVPYKYSTLDGGFEIATGDTVTAMLTLPGNQSSPTLGVYLRSNTSMLYGSDASTFKLVSFNVGSGALPYSAQNLFDTFVMDDLGVISLKTTLNFGNFLPTTLTKNIFPFIQLERTKLVASSVQRSKSQYRLFFNDGYGLWLTAVNQQYLGSSVVLFPNPVSCIDNAEDEEGAEVSYFGSSDDLGYVYQMDVGTSFDGEDIPAFITTAWNPIGSSRILKRYRAASVEIQGVGYAAINFGYQLGYNSTLIGQPLPVATATGFRVQAIWDSFTWDNFTWDGQTLSPTDVDMTGTAENVQFTISSSTNYISAYTLNSIITHYTQRRGLRV